jgi:hypothetical protein
MASNLHALSHLADGSAAQEEQDECRAHPEGAEHKVHAPIWRSAQTDPGRQEEQDASHQPPRPPQEHVPAQQQQRSTDADCPVQRQHAHDEVEAPMHEQERPRSPGEQEEKPARNHPVPGLDQRQHDHPTDDFEEGAQPQRCIHQGYAILR